MKYGLMFASAAAAAILMFAPRAMADCGKDHDREDQPKQSRTNDTQERKSDQARSDEEPQRERLFYRLRQRDPETTERRSEAQEDRRAALRQFMAGLYAGYVRGYRDASDDALVVIVRPQGDAQQQMGRGEQFDRERLREELRSRTWRDQPYQARQPSQFRQQRPQMISGEVLKTKEVELKNTDRKHLVVMLKTDEGQRKIVDLGSTDLLKDLEIMEGKRIGVRGFPVMVGDMRIVRASQVRADGKIAVLHYSRPANADTMRPKSDVRMTEQPGKKPM